MPPKVFISYAHQDRTVAAHLARVLRGQGFSTFLDTDMSPGENTSERLRKELAESDSFVMVKSPASANSSIVQMELGAAWADDKPVFFVIPPGQTNEAAVSLPLDFIAKDVLAMDKVPDAAIGDAIRARLEASENGKIIA